MLQTAAKLLDIGVAKKKHRPPLTTSEKKRATCFKITGLASKTTCVNASEACLLGKSPNLLEAVVIDSEQVTSIPKISETTIKAKQATEAYNLKKENKVARLEPTQNAESFANKIAAPVFIITVTSKTTIYPLELLAMV